MGFMGLNHWGQSDEAADFREALALHVNSAFMKELKNESNMYNTPGWLNALLLFKSYPSLIHFVNDETIDKIYYNIKNDDGYLRIAGGKALVKNFIKLRQTKEK